jgi:hypothetical protein
MSLNKAGTLPAATASVMASPQCCATLSDTEAEEDVSWGVVSARTLQYLADALEAPTLLERAMNGDATAAKQFLHEAGFTDKQGQWLPQYQPTPKATND